MTREVVTLEEIIAQCMQDSHDWFPDTSEDIAFMSLSAAGEIGELCNLVKKIWRASHTEPELLEKMQEELVDGFIYLMNIVGIWQNLNRFDIVEAYRTKRAENELRFGRKTPLEVVLREQTQPLTVVPQGGSE